MSSTQNGQNTHILMAFIQSENPQQPVSFVHDVTRVLAPAHARLERVLVPQTIYAEGMAKPQAVALWSYADNQGGGGIDPLQVLNSVAAGHAGLDVASLSGRVQNQSISEQNLAGRFYLVELAHFGPQGRGAYTDYAVEAEGVMANYGYHVEAVVLPHGGAGLPFKPDLATVAYFDTPDGMDRMHKDPAHHRIEAELYPAAVSRSVWLMGAVHPAFAPPL